MAHIRPNTDKEYPCVRCGSKSANIVKEGPDPRLKCNNERCNFMYDGSMSLQAVEAGAIPSGLPQTVEQNPAVTADRGIKKDGPSGPPLGPSTPANEGGAAYVEDPVLPEASRLIPIPRTPSYVILAKNRQDFEFATKKTLKKTVLKWESQERNYDVFELTPKKAQAKVHIE